jgi:hypothetical protein
MRLEKGPYLLLGKLALDGRHDDILFCHGSGSKG